MGDITVIVYLSLLVAVVAIGSGIREGQRRYHARRVALSRVNLQQSARSIVGNDRILAGRLSDAIRGFARASDRLASESVGVGRG